MPAGVLFLPSFHDAIKNLSNENRLLMYDAIVEYGLYGKIPDLPDELVGYFVLIRPTIDSSKRRYKAAVANGHHGGRPPKNQTNKQSENQTENQSENQDFDLDYNFDFDSDAEKELLRGEQFHHDPGTEFEEKRNSASEMLKAYKR